LVQKYLSRISGPLLDRIDIHIEVTPVSFEELASNRTASEKSDAIRARVIAAREIQSKRYDHLQEVYCNAQMPSNKIKQICVIDETGKQLLKTAINKLNLSARAYDRILKVSRTIADLDASEEIKTQHLAEAIHYRSLDRENWGG
jgi:magnesium chelatase family protein